jgi:hypothetical protein
MTFEPIDLIALEFPGNRAIGSGDPVQLISHKGKVSE